jgi:ADP-ribosylglycohydrolase
MAGFDTFKNLLKYEVKQRAQEGCTLKPANWFERIERIDQTDISGLEQFEDDLMALSPDEAFPYVENSDLEAIQTVRPNGVRDMKKKIGERDYFQKVHGAWLGRCVGVMLGRPFDIEPFTAHPQNLQRKDIQVWLEGSNAWPLASYVPATSPGERWQLKLTHLNSTRGKVKRVEADPRLDATFVVLRTFEDCGNVPASSPIALSWLKYQSHELATPAQMQAMLNMIATDAFARQGRSVQRVEKYTDWNALAQWRNPFREWNGAVRRADLYGLLFPGQPARAAAAAWYDARISHRKNGIYAPMFLAALIAAAFHESDPVKLIDCALSEIPTHSRLARDVKRMVAWCERENSWIRAWDRMMEEYGDYSHAHSILTTLCIVMALLRGKADFSRSLSIAVSAGLDPVTQGAAVGAITGIIGGASAIPDHWTESFQNIVMSHIPGCTENRISECARRTLEVWRNIQNNRK